MEYQAAYESPFGRGWIGFKDQQITETVLPGLSQLEQVEVASQVPDWLTPWKEELEAFFQDGHRLNCPRLFHHQGGSAFRSRVYKAVAAIPPGETRSYGEIAERAGSPGAARAVGTAMAQNRFAPWVPCHRVVPAGGTVGSYGGGVPLKAALLALEAQAVSARRSASGGAQKRPAH
jgi:O-6-methylguanine DNA methyltransferase